MSTMPPLHLALFVRSLGGGGGAERVMVNLAAALAQRGNRVDLVMGVSRGRFFDEIPAAVRVVDLAGPPAPLALPWLWRVPGSTRPLLPVLFLPGPPRVLGAIPGLARYLSRERPDALLSALYYPNLAALVARRLAGVTTRTVISIHNHLSASVANTRRPHVRRVPSLARHFFGEADGIVAVSRGVAQDLAQVAALPSERVTTIYNPVVTPTTLAQASESLAHPWFEAGEPPVLLAAGKLKRQKDFDTLIRAFAGLRRKRRARLVILGEGRRKRGLQILARELGIGEDVELPGFIANPYPFMRRASLFVLSSVFEGFGNVLVEAMACGCPVVSTDCPSGPAEILEGGRHGRLVPVGDADALTAAIEQTLDAPPPQSQLEKRAAEFTADASAARYEQLLAGEPTS